MFYKGHRLACIWVAILLCSNLRGEDSNRFNVLFIAVDDLRPELGCYGVKAAQSPNLDRLAADGVLFNRHYVQVATCGASRYSMLTGRSPARTGATNGNGVAYQGSSAIRREQQAGAQTMPELFRRSGYKTVCIGKISHTADGRVFEYDGTGDGRDELPGAWDELATPFGSWGRGWGIFFAYANGHHREDGQGNRSLMEFVAEKDEDLPDGLLAEAAIEKLRDFSSSGEKFFLGLGFFKPHLPFVAPRQDWEAFEGVDLSQPEAVKPDSPWWTTSPEFFKYDAPFEKKKPLAPDARAMARRAYLACVRYTDRQIGRVLDSLEELGLSDNTIVVVWGDHGWHLGEQEMWGKHSPFERSHKSVLIVRAPGISQAGLKTDALVESTDIYPTLVDLCSPSFNQTHYELDGRSLRSILAGESSSIRGSAISFWKSSVSVRDANHRLIATIKGKNPPEMSGIELYDLEDDPDNVQNVAGFAPEVQGRLLEEVIKLYRRSDQR